MKPKRKLRPAKTAATPAPTEAPAAEFLTVAWMLSVMTALVCEVGAVIAALALYSAPRLTWLDLLSGVLTFAAIVVGLASLALMPLVWKFRKDPPPAPIAGLAFAVGLAPLLAVLARTLLT